MRGRTNTVCLTLQRIWYFDMALKPCPRCGNHISDKAKRCPKCGAELSEKSFLEPVGPENANQPPFVPYPNHKESKPHNKLWWLVVFPIIVIGMIVGCVLYFNNEKEKEEALMIEQKARHDSMVAALQAEREEADRLEQLRQDSIKAVEEEISNRLTINTFCVWDSDNNVLTHSNSKRIFDNLENLGFSLIEENEEYQESEAIGGFTELLRTYQRDKYGYNIIVKTRSDKYNPKNSSFSYVEIIFPDSEKRNQFLETAIQKGFKKNSDAYNSGISYYGPNYEQCYWQGTDLSVIGNIVKLIERFEP